MAGTGNPKGVGRPKGAKNKRSLAMVDDLIERGLDPKEYIVSVMAAEDPAGAKRKAERDEAIATIVRANSTVKERKAALEVLLRKEASDNAKYLAAVELMPYCYAKLKSTEHKFGEEIESITVLVGGMPLAQETEDHGNREENGDCAGQEKPTGAGDKGTTREQGREPSNW